MKTMNIKVSQLAAAIIVSVSFSMPVFADSNLSTGQEGLGYGSEQNTSGYGMSGYGSDQNTSGYGMSGYGRGPGSIEQAALRESCLQEILNSGEIDQAQIDAIATTTGTGNFPQMNIGSVMAGNGFFSESDSCFINAMSDGSQQVANQFMFNRESNINLSSTIMANSQDFGRNADLLVVANYTSESGETNSFMRDNANWVSWDGDINSLTAAQQVQLSEQQVLDIFNGSLADMPGHFSITTGYRIDDGSVIYNPEAMEFDVE